MKLIIDIPEEMYKAIGYGANGFSNYLHIAIRLGTPLNEVLDEIKAQIIEKNDYIEYCKEIAERT